MTRMSTVVSTETTYASGDANYPRGPVNFPTNAPPGGNPQFRQRRVSNLCRRKRQPNRHLTFTRHVKTKLSGLTQHRVIVQPTFRRPLPRPFHLHNFLKCRPNLNRPTHLTRVRLHRHSTPTRHLQHRLENIGVTPRHRRTHSTHNLFHHLTNVKPSVLRQSTHHLHPLGRLVRPPRRFLYNRKRQRTRQNRFLQITTNQRQNHRCFK